MHGDTPRAAMSDRLAYLAVGEALRKHTSAGLMRRRELTAADSFVAIFARIKLGSAIAGMTKMIATTISNSISEKPACFLDFIRAVPIRLPYLHIEVHSHSHAVTPVRPANVLPSVR